MDHIGYIILYVTNLDASVTFYRDVLGLTHRFTDAGYAEFDTQGTRFALYERRRAEWLTNHPVTPGPAAEIVLLVTDVDTESTRLTSLGVPILTPPTNRPWGHRTLHLSDPDGFIIELAQEIPRTRTRRDGPDPLNPGRPYRST